MNSETSGKAEKRSVQQRWLDEVMNYADILCHVKGYTYSYALAIAKAEVPFPSARIGNSE